MASGSNIGIMDEAYFVGRKAIISWINDTFELSIGKIEDTASGTVPMSKVKWDARNDYEFIHNYKILQRVFQKKGVDKHVDVQKLIRGKYQDNLEFMQWMKRWFEMNSSGEDYDAAKRRSRSKSAPKRGPRPSGPRTTENQAAAANRARAAPRGKPKPKPKPRNSRAAPANRSGDADSRRALAEANAQVAELRVSVDGLEKERDFYFGKLRDIEILLQSYNEETGFPKSEELTQHVFKILYATEDDFVVVDEEEEGAPAAAKTPAEPAAEPSAAPEEDLRDLADLNLGDESETATATA